MLTRIGSYPVEREVGRGGMGVVYLARDTRLDRPVAIKVLPDHLAHDPERLARLEREARLLAAVTHPNVAHIYGLEQDGERRLLVLEYVEGETLAEILARGPLALDETLDVCRQVAAALEAAHEVGIVHRDLKPGNIKLTPSGDVKVLDFGLARGPAASDSNPDLSQSPTMTVAATSAGVVLGTAAYMSPEQARGRAVDRRTDIWSFGCVLYECLTGRQAFAGETVSDMIALILQGEPDMSRLPAKTPARLRALLARCFEKDAKRRLRDMGDARIELEELQGLASAQRSGAVPIAGATNGLAGGRADAPGGWGWPTLVALAAVLTLGVAAGFGVARLRAPRPVGPVRFGITAPLRMLLDGEPNNLAISPDGSTLAFVAADSSGNTSLCVRPLGSFDARVLAGTHAAAFPFWSPDGRELGYFSGNTLYRVPAAGGTAQAICDVTNPRGAAWGPHGVIVVAAATGPLLQVRAAGGTPVPATAMAKGETSHRGPCFLPDGEHFLFVTLPAVSGLYPCVRGSLHDLKREAPFGRSLSAPVYAAPGYVLFNHRDALVAQQFDAGRGRLIGDPFAIGAPSTPSNYSATPLLSVSRTGVLAWTPLNAAGRRVEWLDREGRPAGNVDVPVGNWQYGSISHDGSRAALVIVTTGRMQLWVVDFSRGSSQRLDEQDGEIGFPAWSPDDRSLAYDTQGQGLSEIVIRPSDGSGTERHLAAPAVQFRAVCGWSPDGRQLLCQQVGEGTNWDLVTIPVEGGAPRPYVVTRFMEQSGDVSPDGRHALYTSDQSGAPQEYVESFPEPGARQQVSRDTVLAGAWSSNGREVVLVRQDGGMVSVPVVTGPELRVGAPQLLFRTPADTYFCDPTPDGRRFLTIVAAERTTPTISVAVDWRDSPQP